MSWIIAKDNEDYVGHQGMRTLLRNSPGSEGQKTRVVFMPGAPEDPKIAKLMKEHDAFLKKESTLTEDSLKQAEAKRTASLKKIKTEQAAQTKRLQAEDESRRQEADKSAVRMVI